MQLVQILPRRLRELTRDTAKLGTLALNSLNRVLPGRLQGISDEVVKFGVIGVINLVVNFAVANLLWLTVLSHGQLWAKGIATMVATTCAYFMNRHWTYRDRPKSTLRREYTLFLFFNGVGLIIEVAVVGVAKYGFGETHWLVLNLCTGIGIVLGTVFRFWAYRNHVFKLDGGTAAAEEPALVSAAAALATVPDPQLVGAAIPAHSPHVTVANGVAANGVKANGVAADGVHANGVTATGVKANGVKANGVKANGAKANGGAAAEAVPVNGAQPATDADPSDDALEAELAQIELDDIVAGEQTTTRTTS